MRTARTLFAPAAITAVLAISAPAACAMAPAEWTPDSGSSTSRDHEDDFEKGNHDRGYHERSWDGGGYGYGREDHEESWKREGEHEKSWRGERPRGGVHTGGGGLATGSGLAAGSVLLLGGLGAGAFILRRRNASSPAAV